jgi:hypothetical protein
VRQHADDALPGLLLFLPQCAGEVREDQQLVGFAVPAERRAAQLEPAAAGAKRLIEQPRRVAGQASIEAEFAMPRARSVTWRVGR